jgi:hypothetical protein
MGSGNKKYTSPGAKKIQEQKKDNKRPEQRKAKRANVHGDGKPNHNRGF